MSAERIDVLQIIDRDAEMAANYRDLTDEDHDVMDRQWEQAKLARAEVAAMIEERDRLASELATLQCFAGLLVTSVRGHFAYASASSPACCLQACDRVNEALARIAPHGKEESK